MPFSAEIGRLQQREFFFRVKEWIDHGNGPALDSNHAISYIGNGADAHIGQTPSTPESSKGDSWGGGGFVIGIFPTER